MSYAAGPRVDDADPEKLPFVEDELKKSQSYGILNFVMDQVILYHVHTKCSLKLCAGAARSGSVLSKAKPTTFPSLIVNQSIANLRQTSANLDGKTQPPLPVVEINKRRKNRSLELTI